MDRLVEWWGADVLDARRERIEDFWNGRGRFIVTIQSGTSTYRQCFDDETILERVGENLRHQAGLPGENMPSFFADFGTVSTAKHWGGTPRFDSTGDNLFIDPVAETTEEALAVEPSPPDAPDLDPARAVRLYSNVCERLETDRLRLRTPDFQGVLNTAGLIVNQENLLMDMVAEPEAVHALLDRVGGFLLEYAEFMRRATGNRICGNIWPYTFLPSEMGMSFTEDLMPLLSADMYAEFGVPQVERFSEAFGGVHIHCCGRWGRHAANLAASKANILAVEFHHPFTTLDELAPLAGRAVLVPYYNAEEDGGTFPDAGAFYDHLLQTATPETRFWFAFPEDTADARAFVERHGAFG